MPLLTLQKVRVIGLLLVIVLLVGLAGATTVPTKEDVPDSMKADSCYQAAANELIAATDINLVSEQDFHIKASKAYIDLANMGVIC